MIQGKENIRENQNERESRKRARWYTAQPQPDSGAWSEGEDQRQGWYLEHTAQPDGGAWTEGQDRHQGGPTTYADYP